MCSQKRAQVLHYIGYDRDDGGVLSCLRGLAAGDRFDCVLGVNKGFRQTRFPELPLLGLPRMIGERISPMNLLRARRVARTVKAWLREDPRRVFHGHSRAGLLVSLWLHQMGETRFVTSVHCHGLRTWFYRLAARRLGSHLFWLTPAMREYYGMHGVGWTQCIPPSLVEKNIPVPLKKPAADPTVLRLGGIGSLAVVKNWMGLLDAISRLAPSEQACIEFHHIGSEDGTEPSYAYAEALRTFVEARRLGCKVIWRGQEPTSEALLSEVDVLVVPCPREAFSLAAFESLRAGVPVIYASTSGAADFFGRGENGWLFRGGDNADLARCIKERLLTRDHKRIEISETLWQQFTPEVIAARWERVYAGKIESAAG